MIEPAAQGLQKGAATQIKALKAILRPESTLVLVLNGMEKPFTEGWLESPKRGQLIYKDAGVVAIDELVLDFTQPTLHVSKTLRALLQ